MTFPKMRRKCPTVDSDGNFPVLATSSPNGAPEPFERGQRGVLLSLPYTGYGSAVDAGETGDLSDGGSAFQPPDEIVETVHNLDDGAAVPHAQAISEATLPQIENLHSGVTSDARQALAEFLQRDQQAWKADGRASSERDWCEKNGFSDPSEIRRARQCKLNLGIDKLSRYAEMLGVEPWQLLFPDFDRNSPNFPSMSEEAVRVAHAVDRIKDPMRRARAEAAISALVTSLLDETSPASVPTPDVGSPLPPLGPRRGPRRGR